MRASRQFDNQAPETDADAHHLLDSSKKRFTHKKVQKIFIASYGLRAASFFESDCKSRFFERIANPFFFGSSRRAHLWALQERD